MKSTASKKQLKGIYKWYSMRKFRHIMSEAVKRKIAAVQKAHCEAQAGIKSIFSKPR